MNHRRDRLLLAASLVSLLGVVWSGPTLATFTPNGDLTVTDSETGLVWDRCAWGQTWDGATCTGFGYQYTWAQALDAAMTANTSVHRNQSDWRLPSITELESLADYSRSFPAIDIIAFPGTPSMVFWSSTTSVSDPARAWYINFIGGDARAFDKATAYHVRLVRGGQSFDLLSASYAITATANPTAGGSVSCDVNPVDHGGNSTCTATTNTGYTLAGFTGNCAASGNTCTFSNITGAESVSANFTLNTYPITTGANPTAGGSVSCDANPVGYDGTSICTATANAGYTLAGFTGNCAVNGTACTFSNVTTAESVTANFTLNSYAIATGANPSAGGSITCDVNPVDHGGSSTCTATTNTGYTLTGFTGNCTASGNTCAFNNVTGAESVTANFTLNSYAITTGANPSAGGSVSCDINPVDHGGSSTCTATTNTGYTLAGFTGNCTVSGNTCAFNNVTMEESVSANFTLNSYTITASAQPTAGGTVTCSPNPVDHGASSSCTATRNEADGYLFGGFSGDCSGETCELTDITGERQVIATFFLPPGVPTLSEWAMLLLAGLLGLFGVRVVWNGRRPAP